MFAIFTTALSFISSPIGKIVTWIVSVLAVCAVLWGLLAIHDRKIATQATLEFNKKQLEQVVKDQQKYQADTEQLKVDSAKQLDLLKAQTENLDLKLKPADNYLANLPKSDQEIQSSQVLKNVFKMLGTSK